MLSSGHDVKLYLTSWWAIQLPTCVLVNTEFLCFGVVYRILQRKNTEDKLTHLHSPSARTIPA